MIVLFVLVLIHFNFQYYVYCKYVYVKIEKKLKMSNVVSIRACIQSKKFTETTFSMATVASLWKRK